MPINPTDRQPVHVSTVIDNIQQNLSNAIKRKEAKERADRERAEKLAAKTAGNLVRQELPKGRVVVSEPPRPVARHATELPFPAAVFEERVGTIDMAYVTIDGQTWRATTQYKAMVKKVFVEPDPVARMRFYQTMTTPTPLRRPMVVPTGIFPKPAPKIATPENPS